MVMIEVVILLVRDPLSSLTEPNNVIRLLCSRVDRLSLSRAITDCSRLGTLCICSSEVIVQYGAWCTVAIVTLVLRELLLLLLR